MHIAVSCVVLAVISATWANAQNTKTGEAQMSADTSGILHPVTRRRLLTGAGAGLAVAGLTPGLSRPFVANAFAQSKTLTIVQWSHFVPAFDTWFDKFAHDWGTKNGIQVTVDHIPEQNIPARAAGEGGAG
jgi:hypothetical protein